MKPFSFALTLLAAASLPALAASPTGKDYPSQPIRVIVPFGAGGGTDIITRIVTERLADDLGQPLVIENRAGGNTIIGANAAAKAAPDGYTLLATLDMSMTILPAVYQSLPFDPSADFEPVSVLARVPALFVANPDVPANDLKELIEYSKAHPGELNYASAVLYGQLLGEQMKSLTDLSYTYVPYKSSPEAMSALASGTVDFMMLDIATGLGFIKEGRVKPLAITSPERSPQLPDVPTVGELGFPELDMSVWYAMFAPRGTPRPVIDTLNAGIGRVLAEPDIQQRLTQLGHDAAPSTPEELANMVKTDTIKWTKAARDGNVRLD